MYEDRSRAGEYLRRAAEIRQLARGTRFPEVRTGLLMMAAEFERLTDQVADALMDVLDPRGVGVVIEAYHLCMMMRGVEKQNSKTVTSALRGALLQDAKTRDEFLRLVYSGRGSE